MQRYEYKVIPAPKRGEKARGVKTTEDRFAHALMQTMNQLGADGWEYVRSDTLPCEERSGLTGTKTTFQNMLVFRRPLDAEDEVEPAKPVLRLVAEPPPEVVAPRLGPAEQPLAGPVPSLGPARITPDAD